MSHIQINWKPKDRQLKQFGLISLVGFPLAGWVLSGLPGWKTVWSDGSTAAVCSLMLLGVTLATLGFVRPQLLKPVFLLLSLVTFPIGLVVSEVVVLTVYVTAFVPMGLFFRLTGRDAMQRTIDRNRPSYWEVKPQSTGPKSYFRQS